MTKPVLDDQEVKPLDPAVENVRRKLVRFAVINLGLLLLALMAVVAAIVYKTRTPVEVSAPASDIPAPPDGRILEGEISLPLGASIRSQSLSGSRISLEVEQPDGSHTLYLYDLAERRMIGRFGVTAR